MTRTHAEARLDTRDVPWGRTWAAATLLAHAYRDGAIWTAAGPRMPVWYRKVVLTALYLAEIAIVRLKSGVVLGAFRDDRLDGVLLLYRDGERTIPWWGWALRAVACVLAGPFAMVRAVRISNALDRLKPERPHVFFAVLGRRDDSVGAGYALLRAGQARADGLGLPGYLETSAGQEQVRINELLGWSTMDEYTLSTGRVIKTMWRDCAVRS